MIRFLFFAAPTLKGFFSYYFFKVALRALQLICLTVGTGHYSTMMAHNRSELVNALKAKNANKVGQIVQRAKHVVNEPFTDNGVIFTPLTFAASAGEGSKQLAVTLESNYYAAAAVNYSFFTIQKVVLIMFSILTGINSHKTVHFVLL